MALTSSSEEELEELDESLSELDDIFSLKTVSIRKFFITKPST